ncbi:MAG: lipocalin family protein [Pseudomonadota bacterium]|nr:lipocalin family protein [Pseudomonadota bacterium]
MRLNLLVVLLLFISACTTVPEGIKPVQSFEVEAYLGKWYEIARLDHGFERGLSQVTAEYSLRDDGGIRVINRGYSAADDKWEQAEGKAYFVEDKNTAHLKVSFFGPFYGSYIVFELDPQYQYAFISGPSRDYLWLLARQQQVSDKLKSEFIAAAKAKGFAVDELIFVEQPEEATE